MKNGKKLLLIVHYSLLLSVFLTACENPWIEKILEPKTVTFNSNGGSPVSSQNLIKGEKVQRPTDPYRDSDIFLGWFEDDKTFEIEWSFLTIPTKDLTLYAHWEEITITKADGAQVDTPTVTSMRGQMTITVISPTGTLSNGQSIEYAKSETPIVPTTAIWQTDTVFSELEYGKTYYIFARSKENDSYKAGTPQVSIAIKLEPITTVAQLKEFLDSQPPNNNTTPYKVVMEIDNANLLTNIAQIISDSGKYVYLDLSGSNITTIQNNAFYQCSGLTSVTIPDSVTSIGESAFSQCTSLASVTIPNTVNSIEEYAFFDCSSLASVTIGSGVTGIGKGAFEGTGLISVTFESGTTALNSDTFYGLGDLSNKYFGGGAGTYTRAENGDVWTKKT
jgi:uncharacterized repeat protein (TIGR02543 family)